MSVFMFVLRGYVNKLNNVDKYGDYDSLTDVMLETKVVFFCFFSLTRVRTTLTMFQ
jgi:hypothetical protein